MYDAEVLADSISGLTGTRLITVIITFPRFILAEVNTHRVFSRNSASSRAIPPEIHIERIEGNPFIPEIFRKRVKGMGQGEELAIGDQEEARATWIAGRDHAVNVAKSLCKLDISKTHVNRILEPYMWHTAIITSTEWDNYFALRTPPGNEVDFDFPAQPEFQKVGILMRSKMRESNPSIIMPGEWHTPLVNPQDFPEMAGNAHAALSAGRCAKVSYDTQEKFEEPEASLLRTDSLIQYGHMSPTEHCATPMNQEELSAVEAQKAAINQIPGLLPAAAERMISQTEMVGNFRDWVQMRKRVPFEWNRVGYLEKRSPWWATDNVKV